MVTDYYLPTRIVFGCGCVQQAGALAVAWGKRALLVCGTQTPARSTAPANLSTALELAGIETTLYAAVSGEADLEMVANGIKTLLEARCDMVIGLGGGSAIDTAKAIAGLAPQPGNIRDYHAGRKLESPGLPMIAIPTTAGTGAEVTRNAVLIDQDNRLKQSIRGDDWFPKVALVDPDLTVSMGAALTAHTGSDALCQAIEAYTSIAASDITDGLAERAITLISRNLGRAYSNGQDIGAREAMSMGSLLAGMAMAVARLGLVHGIAHPVGSRHNIPHGLVCGLLLPHVMRYNLKFAAAKYARMLTLMGNRDGGDSIDEAAKAAVDAVQQLLARVGVPEHLGPYGVQPQHLQAIISETMPSGSTKHNARPVSEADVRQIMLKAL